MLGQVLRLGGAWALPRQLSPFSTSAGAVATFLIKMARYLS